MEYKKTDFKYRTGEFICPKCGKNEFNAKYSKWTSRLEYSKDSPPQTKYIFYKKKNACACCLCSFFCCYSNSDKYGFYTYNAKCMKCKEIFMTVICFPCYLICLIFYLLFCSIADIFNLCCCRYEEYEDVCEYSRLGKEYDKEEKEYKPKEDYYILAKNDKDIWNYCKGFTEIEWKVFKMETKCLQCNYTTDTFIDFINNRNVTIIQDGETSSGIIEGPNVAVNFCSTTTGNYPIVCKLNQKFSAVKNILFKKHPELKSKKCFFLGNGQILDPDLTLIEQGIKDGENIILGFEE